MPSPQPLAAHDPVFIGPYRTVGYLGAGGQGSVYLAEAPDGSSVAVKLLHPQFGRGGQAQKRFVREVEAASKVSAYTARVLAVDIHQGVPYVVSQYISGDSLASLVAASGPLDADGLLRLATGTLTALATIHGAGIVHCDFKPDNVLFGPDGPRVIDFGIARALDTIEPHTSRRIGTPAYMAPEQIELGQIGPHTDMFAWGVTLVYAATGTPAFGAQTSGDPGGNAVMHRILNKEPDLTGLPDPLRAVAAAALAKKPHQRPTAHDALLTLLGQTPASADRTRRDTQPQTRRWLPDTRNGSLPAPRPHRRTVLLATLGALAALSILASLYYVISSSPLPPVNLTLTGHIDSVNSVAFSPDGTTLATGSDDETVRLWEVATGHTTATLIGDSRTWVKAVAFSLDGRTLAAGGSDGTVRLWNVASGKSTVTLTGHTGTVNSVAFSPDSATVASASDDHTVRLWNVASGKSTATLTDNTNWVKSVAFSADGKTLAAGGSDGTVRLWNATSGKSTATLTGDVGWSHPLAFSPDSKTLATGSGETVRLWNVTTRKSTATLTGHTGTVNSVAFSPDGTTLASGSDDHTVRLWKVATGLTTAIFTGHTDTINSVAFSPDGIVASGSKDHTARLRRMN